MRWANRIGERVLIVGAGENSGLADWIFSQSTLGKTSSVIGIVDDDPRKQGMRINGNEVLGTTTAIPELVKKYDVGIICYTIDNIQETQRARILSLCRVTGVKVIVLPDILEILRKEMRVIKSPHRTAINSLIPHKKPEVMLDEIQALLVEYKVEEAQKQLSEFRRQYLPKNR